LLGIGTLPHQQIELNLLSTQFMAINIPKNPPKKEIHVTLNCKIGLQLIYPSKIEQTKDFCTCFLLCVILPLPPRLLQICFGQKFMIVKNMSKKCN
jgi:hypothetical protein